MYYSKIPKYPKPFSLNMKLDFVNSKQAYYYLKRKSF